MKVNTLALAFLPCLFIACNQIPLADSNTNCSMDDHEAVVAMNLVQSEEEDKDGLPEDQTETRSCLVPEQIADVPLEIEVELSKFDQKQSDKMHEALKRLKVVINSVEFREAVIGHTYKEEQTYVQNDGLSNEEIYEKIMLGAETLRPIENRVMDLEIELYYSRKKVIGYTYPNVSKFWVNTRYFNTNSHSDVVGNVVHEWLHKLGFEHDFKRTARRPYSVPYAVGKIMRELVKKM